MEITIIILSVALAIVLLISIFLTFSAKNLFKNLEIVKKENESYKEEIRNSLLVFNNIEEKIVWSQTILNGIDQKGLFAADDEIGWFFKNIQLIQDELNGFRFKKIPKEKIEENNKNI